jgi:Tfp pilus assembly protein PilX
MFEELDLWVGEILPRFVEAATTKKPTQGCTTNGACASAPCPTDACSLSCACTNTNDGTGATGCSGFNCITEN